MLSIIVAKAKNNVIGKNNQLIWHLPEDLIRFKEITTGHTIIMGRKTFESLGRVLSNRKHVILTKNQDYKVNDENVEIVHSLSEIEEYIKCKDEVFVIGGEAIYSLLMPYTTKMYITQIEQSFEGDVYFPEFDDKKWDIIKREKHFQINNNQISYEYIIYEKRI